MTTRYAANYKKAYNDSPSELLPWGEKASSIMHAYAEYALEDVVLAQDDVIHMLKLPKGARILNVVLYSDDLGSTGSLSVGSSDDLDRYIPSSDCTSAKIVNMTDAVADGQFEKLSAETIVAVKAVAASTATTGTIRVGVSFVVA